MPDAVAMATVRAAVTLACTGLQWAPDTLLFLRSSITPHYCSILMALLVAWRKKWDGHCATCGVGVATWESQCFSPGAPLVPAAHLHGLWALCTCIFYRSMGAPGSSAFSIRTACTGLSPLTSLPHSGSLAGSPGTMGLLAAVCLSVPNHPEQNKLLPHFGFQRISLCFILSWTCVLMKTKWG